MQQRREQQRRRLHPKISQKVARKEDALLERMVTVVRTRTTVAKGSQEAIEMIAMTDDLEMIEQREAINLHVHRETTHLLQML